MQSISFQRRVEFQCVRERQSSILQLADMFLIISSNVAVNIHVSW